MAEATLAMEMGAVAKDLELCSSMETNHWEGLSFGEAKKRLKKLGHQQASLKEGTKFFVEFFTHHFFVESHSDGETVLNQYVP